MLPPPPKNLVFFNVLLAYLAGLGQAELRADKVMWLKTVERALTGCEERLWPVAAQTACALVRVLEGALFCGPVILFCCTGNWQDSLQSSCLLMRLFYTFVPVL